MTNQTNPANGRSYQPANSTGSASTDTQQPGPVEDLHITAKTLYYVLCTRQADQGGVRVKNVNGGDFAVSSTFDDAADYASLVGLCRSVGILSVDIVLGHAVFTIPKRICDFETQVRFERAAHGKWEV